MRELLTNYGEISVAWFDRGIYTPEEANEFVPKPLAQRRNIWRRESRVAWKFWQCIGDS